ncbi:hypothetical protein OMP38_08690 [Cohnella ginsengisoli]|uniref:Uncharacterized protein n=1 Tax=Cohnella ginsengisoli TaxID=425004 RepID=A0A9X4KF57_9BACL|nr:hypothetical protein [Cohnella ginsengisoli]MDG0790932.1 hypothetical protein [Cohnella ginsengisoli]
MPTAADSSLSGFATVVAVRQTGPAPAANAAASSSRRTRAGPRSWTPMTASHWLPAGVGTA